HNFILSACEGMLRPISARFSRLDRFPARPKNPQSKTKGRPVLRSPFAFGRYLLRPLIGVIETIPPFLAPPPKGGRLMDLLRKCVGAGVFFTSALALVGCPPPGSFPGVTPSIQIGPPPPDTTNNSISIAAADVNRSNITAGTSIRLISSATGGIFVTSNVTWQ